MSSTLVNGPRPYRPTTRCGRCGLTFGTRWEWGNHGCEMVGVPGLISQHTGKVILRRFPAELHDPEAVWRLRDILTVRREAVLSVNAALYCRTIGPITASFEAFTAALRSMSDTLLREVPPLFRMIAAAAPQPQQVVWVPSELTGDSFSEMARRFNAAMQTPPYPVATLEFKTVTVRVNRCPVPGPEFPRRWAKLGNTRRGGRGGERARDNRRERRGR